MSDSISAREVIERLVKQAGIRKKLAAEILRVIPEIIEAGLKRDGEVRVKGLGTFRLKWVRVRTGRNPKTGERVEIPAHNRLVFLPEKSFKEYINLDYRLLSYKIIPGIEKGPAEEHIIHEPEPQHPQEPYFQPEPEHPQESRLEHEPQPQFQPEPELPPTKRRIHWIVPVAVSVVIILGLVFYFRNCYHVGSRQSAAERSDVPGEARDRSQQPVQSSPEADEGSAVDSQQSAVSGQQPAEPIQISKLNSQNSELRTATDGKHLFKLAREVYGNPYLWVLIYKENQDKIPDPDMLISGRELVIPMLEGTPERLTRNDSLAVSEGYLLVYEFYKARHDSRAEDFYKSSGRYKPS